MSVIIKFYLLNSLFYLIFLAVIFIVLNRLITGPVSFGAPLIFILLIPVIIVVAAFFSAHKFTGSAFHAIPPIIITVFILLIPRGIRFIKKNYIPVDFEELVCVYDEYYNAKGKTIAGIKKGLFKYYNPDTGILHHEAVWSNGVIEGYSVFYYPDGKKEMEGNLKPLKDMPVFFEHRVYRCGKWLFYNKDGSLRDTRIYDENGVLVSSDACRLYQKKEGENIYRIYELKNMLPFTGKITREAVIDDKDDYPYHTTAEIKNGYIEGPWEEFSSFDGLVLVSRGSAKSGYPDGEYTSYYEDGRIEEKAFFVMGKFNGEYKTFYQNGNLKSSGFFKDHRRQGLAQWFYENGNLEKETEYDLSGNVINERHFDKDGNLISNKD
ncbi:MULTISPECIES: hypothetical protein [unclassified Treponema]|uniref:hypothetical protein n=1 Tax=unclassified Treponema TaxID=2638727 RepID=UPI0020A45EB7|nr:MULTISPECIES: hypothetical protein [unclassified Treponema]UTC67542.1 hypothetical protein E4O06_02390 [Treponema sp. OMZ 789]UTC70270.1 hypothetical protein E4O01_02380 [Treponema sp. OMZ 790]UTC72985.1 hypothetical protein E4O02_02380 [Treponema sp. OMZ 791]